MKKSLAFFTFNCCGGCQKTLTDDFEYMEKIQKYYDISNNTAGVIDIAIIEGSIDTDEQKKNLRKIRKNSKMIIIIGACAHLGGVQSQRNNLSSKLIHAPLIRKITDIIKVDYIIPGCPISKDELTHCLLDIYWNKSFSLPDLAVCFECHQNGNDCLVKNNKPCLGPITRMGCNSACINAGEICLGCRGQIPAEANNEKLKEILHPMIGEEKTNKTLSFYEDI